MSAEPKTYLTIKEAASRMGLKVPTLRRLVKAGKVKSLRTNFEKSYEIAKDGKAARQYYLIHRDALEGVDV